MIEHIDRPSSLTPAHGLIQAAIAVDSLSPVGVHSLDGADVMLGAGGVAECELCGHRWQLGFIVQVTDLGGSHGVD